MTVEIGALAPQEWQWLVARSIATGWEQLVAQQREQVTPEGFAERVRAMLGRAIAQPGGGALVAREQGTPIGYLVAGVGEDELTGARFGIFGDIFVEPAWRGRGVSSQLTAAGEARLRSLGLQLVRRTVAAQNGPSLRHALADGCQVERYVLIKAL